MSEKVVDALVAAGILSNKERCSRVVIDLQAGQVAVIHARYFGDDRLLDVVHSLDGVEVRDGGFMPHPDAGKPVPPCPVEGCADPTPHAHSELSS